MRVEALFSDYDGTLARDDVAPGDSVIPPDLAVVLRRAAAHVPFCLITSKDYSFIHRRTPYARAWACVSGLDVVFSDGASCAAVPTGDVEAAMAEARSGLPGVRLEEKRGASVVLLGFSLDWRGAGRPDGLAPFLERFRGAELFVDEDGSKPFADVFAAPPRKGEALRALRERLAAGGLTMYLGDSRADRSAFHEADLAVGVFYGQEARDLGCRYWVDSDELSLFLSALDTRGFEFSEVLPGLYRAES